MSEFYALFFICFVAVLAPLIARLSPFMRMPVVVLELMFGILIGPSGFNWVTSQGAIGFLGEFGLIFLFFQAGFEFNPERIGAVPLRLGALAWFAAFGLTIIFAGFLFLVGLVRAPLLVAIMLPTTAFGMLISILHDSGDLDNDFGRYVLGAAVVGELGPVVLASIVLAHQHHHLHETILTMVFFGVAIGAILLARRLRSDKLSLMIARWLGDRSVLPVRISILILLGLVSFANELGIELVLGAYAAGMVIAILVRGTTAEILEDRLESLGSGFFVPLFFVISGVEFDLPSLVTSPASLARLILFLAGFLLVRAIPVVLYQYKRVLPERDLLPLALLSSTTMPLVVAVTFLGVRSGDMLPENASALVGAAVLTVIIFPTLANVLRLKSEMPQPEGYMAIATHRLATLASAQFSRFLGFVAARTWGNP
jgi:Kef-type K+ transport system membrane component KefB